MGINEAIESLRQDLNDPGSVPIEVLNEAQQLGIEALEREKGNRDNPHYGLVGTLPSESKR